jgi:UDP-3-O-[3-hydroxymyristoyl] glucosamine N-acyltransferase
VYSLAELAQRLGVTVTGDARRTVSGLASLAQAGPSDLSFYNDPRYLAALEATRAGAVILSSDAAGHSPVDCLLADDPYLAFARASALFAPARTATIHPAATVEPDAVLGDSVSVGAGAYIGSGAVVGAHSVIHPNAVIYSGVTLGEHCTVHSGAVLGADGFGFARGPDGWEKIHQHGGLRVGDRVEIGAGTTVDRGTLDDTVIGDGVIIDNQVQVAHNCRIGRNTAIAACCGIAGGTVIGAGCTLAGGVGIVGHVVLCDGVHVTGMTMVTHSITEPGSYSSGTRMTRTGEWRRNAVRLSQLDATYRSTQRRLASLEAGRSTEGD